MLVIYHSNRLDVLEEMMEFVVSHERIKDPFEPEMVVVQSTGMAQWLLISLAQLLGIAANIEFALPASFIWEMFMRVLPEIPQQTAFSKLNINWKLMILLPEMLLYEEFLIVRRYLNDETDKKKLFQLTSSIADLYDQYLIYRPNWLTAWEAGQLIKGLSEALIWQARLWKSLVELTKKLGLPQWHGANLYDRFIAKMKSLSKLNTRLPTRVFIFGISTLPPVYLDTLKALGKHIDIHILFNNPCRHYWGDIQDASCLVRLKISQRQRLSEDRLVLSFKKGKNTALLFDVDVDDNRELPNPLLSSWGKSGRDYIYMLSNIYSTEKDDVDTIIKDIDAFVEITPDSLLHNVQLDILNLENRAITGTTTKELTRSDMKHQLNPDDRSFTVHICHSPQREVEILHDLLLATLLTNPDLVLRDIVVMIANIDDYIPFIQAVFGGAKGDRYVPYTISDYRALQCHPLIHTFITLLSLPKSRFTSEEVLALLDVSTLASRFNINERSLLYLRRWVSESGIRWGLDDDNVQDLLLPVTGQHTWKFGLTRMLLGYAMESSKGEWKDILPYDEPRGFFVEIIGNLAFLLTLLTRWYRKLKQAYTLTVWLPLCREMMHDFFVQNSETEAVMATIEQLWKDIVNEGITSNYSENIPLSVLRDELIKRLNRETVSLSFLSGPVNICTLMPMRSIPFKAIFLLGMNDGVYPRKLAPLSFDLIRLQPKRGDQSRRDDDRYLFLETLMSAQQKLYISYIGRSIRDNSERLPSVLVQELVDYVGQSHYLLGDETYNCDESERRVKTHITFYHSRMPFDSINYQLNEQLSYAREWLPASKKEGTARADFILELKPMTIRMLTFEQLLHFWSHPVRAFFQQRLRINFDSEKNIIPKTEPFTLEGVNLYQFNLRLLNALVEQEDTQDLFLRYRASGYLPYGAFGEIIWETLYLEMQTLALRVIKCRLLNKNLEIDLDCNGILLTGWLHDVQSDGLLRWRPSIFSISQGLQLWLEHLVYSASGNEGESRLFLRKGDKWSFPPMAIGTAQNYLNLFIQGYLQGMNKPLLLLPESGGAWVKACYEVKSGIVLTDRYSLKKARNKFFRAYRGSSNMTMYSEGKDVWYQHLNRKFELEYFDSITDEAKRYLLPLFQFNQS